MTNYINEVVKINKEQCHSDRVPTPTFVGGDDEESKMKISKKISLPTKVGIEMTSIVIPTEEGGTTTDEESNIGNLDFSSLVPRSFEMTFK